MADEDAEIANLDQLYRETMAPPPATGGGYDRSKRGWVSLLGEALGGGQEYGSTEERESGGLRALTSAGINMMLNSGYRQTPLTFGQILATGLGGAQQSLGETEQRVASRQSTAAEAQKERLERIAKAIPILKFKEELKESQRVRNAPNPFAAAPAEGAPNPAGQAAVAMTPYVAPDLPAGVTPAIDQAVRTVIGESGGEGPQGQIAVAHVINNRVTGSGKTPTEVIFTPHAFEPWNNPATRAKLEAIKPSDPQYQRVLNEVVLPVLQGKVPDPTGGATHFYSPTAQKALGREAPPWSGKPLKAEIGRHRFYSPDAPAATATATPPAAPVPVLGVDGQPTGLVRQPNGNVGTPGGGFRRPPAAGTADVAPTAGAQVAGPGAPSGGPVAPPSPAVAGNVEAIVAGMERARAIGPGQGVQAAGPAAPQPDEDFETFRRRTMPRPTPEQEAAFRAAPDAGTIAQLNAAEQLAISQWPLARTTAEQAQIKEKVSAIRLKRAEILETAKTGGGTRRAAWEKEEADRLFKIWEAGQGEQREVRKAEKAAELAAQQKRAEHEMALTTERLKTEGQVAVEGAKQEGAYAYGELKKFSDRRNAIRTNLDNLEMLRNWSESAGPSTLIDNININGQTGRDIMVKAGLGDRAQREKWGAQQAFNALINKTVLGLKEGVSMGPMTDKDLDFLRDMTVKQTQDPRTRADIISYMERFEFRQKAYIDNVQRLWDGGKGMTWGKALVAAEEGLPDLVPNVPDNWDSLPDSAKIEFLNANDVKHGSLMRMPPPRDRDGKVTGPGRLSRYKEYEDPPVKGGR